MKVLKIALIGVVAVVSAYAQDMGGMGGGSGMGGKGGGAGGGGDMGANIPMGGHVSRLDQMTTILKLNKDEKKSVKAIMDDGEKHAAPVREQMAKTRAAIAEAIAAGKGQPEIDAAVKDYAEAAAQMTSIELHSFAKIYSGLERDQQMKSPQVLQMMAGIFKTKNWNE